MNTDFQLYQTFYKSQQTLKFKQLLPTRKKTKRNNQTKTHCQNNYHPYLPPKPPSDKENITENILKTNKQNERKQNKAKSNEANKQRNQNQREKKISKRSEQTNT